MNTQQRRRIIGLLTILTLGACSTKDATDPNGNNGGGDPTITLTLSSSALSLVQAASGTVTANITRGGGFSGTVNIEITGAPSGMTATPGPASIPSNSTSSTITVSPGASLQPGTYTLTVRASGTGVSAVTATFQVTVTAASQGGFTLSIAPASGSIQQGQQTTATVSIGRTGGFSGSVDLAVSGGPGSDLTASLSPASTTGNTSTLTLAAAAGLAPGTYNLTVTGNASGLTQQAVSYALTVTSQGGFTLSMAPSSGSVQQGQQTTATVNINRTGGFAGAVDLTVSGAVAGLTASLSPTSTTGNTSTLTLAASGSLAAGSYNLTVTGSASGLTQQMASYALTVTSSGGGSGNTTWSFCPGEVPVWFAYQDGTSAWMQVQPSNSAFTFPLNSGRGGVAYVTGMSLNIFYGTQQELSLYGMQCGSTPAPTKTVNGSVAGLQPTDQAYISLGGGAAVVSGLGSSTFQLTGVQEGLFDLVATRSALMIVGSTVQTTLAKLIIRRGLNPPNGTTLPVLDFNSPEAFDPVQRNLTVNNLGTDMAIVTAAFITTGSGVATLYSDLGQTAGANRQYYGVPSANRMSGDVHVLSVSAFSGQAVTDYRAAAVYFSDATDKSVTLGPKIAGLNVNTVNSAAYGRLRAQYAVQSEYDDVIVFAGGQANGRNFTIFASKDYTNGAATYDFEIPDFTGVGGWLDTYGPALGVLTSWSFSASGYNMAGGLAIPQIDGLIAQIGATSGQITP